MYWCIHKSGNVLELCVKENLEVYEDKKMVEKRMNIATALNEKYVKYTCVMLTSLLMNQTGVNIHVYLLHNDLTQREREQLRILVEGYNQNIHFLWVNKESLPTGLPTTKAWSLECYFRLMLLDILPVDIDRILYLDVDMIINKSIKELYWTDFENALFCACPDMILNERFEEGFTYFNSGMMLWNIEKLRGRYCFKDYMNLAESLNYDVKAPDQDLLNMMHDKQVKFLDEYKYNLFAKIAYDNGIHYENVKEETTIIHYAGMKPWAGGVHYDIEQLWWDYAKLTPFYFELLESFLHSCINDPFIYQTLSESFRVNKQLIEELGKSEAMCQHLLQLVEGNIADSGSK